MVQRFIYVTQFHSDIQYYLAKKKKKRLFCWCSFQNSCIQLQIRRLGDPKPLAVILGETIVSVTILLTMREQNILLVDLLQLQLLKVTFNYYPESGYGHQPTHTGFYLFIYIFFPINTFLLFYVLCTFTNPPHADEYRRIFPFVLAHIYTPVITDGIDDHSKVLKQSSEHKKAKYKYLTFFQNEFLVMTINGTSISSIQIFFFIFSSNIFIFTITGQISLTISSN